ncbi:MAG: ABC transporter permease [Clostridia bacterium]|nr:ABC transporter permease [Clostridia bacterium]
MKKKKLTFNSLALGNLKHRKKRYTLMIFGIILSMVFSSSIIYFAYSIYDTTVKQTEADYGFYDWFDSGYSESVFKEFKTKGYLEEYGVGKTIGFMFTDEKDKINGTPIAKLDETAKRLVNPILIDGTYPENKGEIAIEQATLLQLGLSAKVGDKITLKYQVQNGEDLLPEIKEKTYTLTGILRDKRSNVAEYGELLPSAFVSNSEKVDLGGKENTLIYSVVNRKNVKGVSSWALREDKGLSPDPEIWVYKELGYLATSLEGYTHVIMVIVVVVILLIASSLGIINTFASNLKERKKQIGFYRAVGATKKQIFSLFMREALILAVICTPVSLLISFFAVKLIIVKTFSNYFFTPNLWVLLVCGAFSIFSVFMASLIPLFSAMRITPLQAIRNIEAMRKFKNKKIKGQKDFDASKLLAKRNMLVSRRKQVVVSIFLTITIIFSSYAMSYMTYEVNNIGFIGLDYALKYDYDLHLSRDGGNAYYNSPESNNGFSENHIQTVLNHESITSFYGEKGAEAIIEYEADDISNYFRLATDVAGDVNIDGSKEVNKDNYIKYFEEQEAEYSGGDFESQETVDVKNATGYDGDILQVNLISVDGELIEKLSSVALMSGKVNIDKLDSGEQVLVIAPAKIYVTVEEGYTDTKDIVSRWNSEYTEELIEANPEILITTEECDIVPGDILDIGVVYAENPDPDYDAEGKPYLEKEKIITQTRSDVEIGGVLDMRCVGESISHFADFTIVTTHEGMEKFFSDAKYKEVKFVLNGDCTEETDKEICTILNSVAECVDEGEYTSKYENIQTQKEEWKNLGILLYAIVILFYTICGSIVNNTVMATIKEDKKKIGTLRAVGANEKEISKSYILQLLSMFKWGFGIGFGGFALSYLIIVLTNKYTSLAEVLVFNPWVTLLLGLILFAICSLSVYTKIRKETRNSIVENIREL